MFVNQIGVMRKRRIVDMIKKRGPQYGNIGAFSLGFFLMFVPFCICYLTKGLLDYLIIGSIGSGITAVLGLFLYITVETFEYPEYGACPS